MTDARRTSAYRTPVIGLIGGIAAGKSAVARMLGDLGCIVSDSDALARAALRDPSVRAQLVDWWGEDILDSDGEVDRSTVARIVFSDPHDPHDPHDPQASRDRRRLEQVVHPWIEQRRVEQFAAADHDPDVPALVIDAPLLLEAGLDRECDLVIFVDAPREQRLRRVMRPVAAGGRGWDEAELDRRERSQMPLDEKRRRADRIINNTGDLDQLRTQVEQILAAIPAGCADVDTDTT